MERIDHPHHAGRRAAAAEKNKAAVDSLADTSDDIAQTQNDLSPYPHISPIRAPPHKIDHHTTE